MDSTFIDILKKLTAEQGKEALLNPSKCKALLADYTKGDYKKESRLLLQALDAGVSKEIDTTGELELCKRQQIRMLYEEYGIDQEIAADIVDALALVLRGQAPQGAFCVNCGKELQKEWGVCPYCGTTVAKIQQNPPETEIARVESVKAETPKAESPPEQAPYEQMPSATLEVHPPPNKKKNTKRNLIIAGVVLLVIIIVVISEITSASNTASSSSNSSQTSIPAVESSSAKPASPAQTVVPAMMRVEGGTFTMGSPANEPERSSSEVQHQVTVSSFYMGKYEVTQKEYQEVMKTNPSRIKGDNLPVEEVSWYDAIEYCNKRSQKEGLIPAYSISGTGDNWTVTWNKNANGYRLPTEAEWEYACRAGTTTPFSTGNNVTTSQANYNGNPYNNNAKGTYRQNTTTVGSFAPNAWGLYDMHGNVSEWCWDWYGSYSSGAQTDPTGASSGVYRIIRGGGWAVNAAHVRSAYRSNSTPSDRDGSLGFRLVRSSLV